MGGPAPPAPPPCWGSDRRPPLFLPPPRDPPGPLPPLALGGCARGVMPIACCQSSSNRPLRSSCSLSLTTWRICGYRPCGSSCSSSSRETAANMRGAHAIIRLAEIRASSGLALGSWPLHIVYSCISRCSSAMGRSSLGATLRKVGRPCLIIVSVLGNVPPSAGYCRNACMIGSRSR